MRCISIALDIYSQTLYGTTAPLPWRLRIDDVTQLCHTCTCDKSMELGALNSQLCFKGQ